MYQKNFSNENYWNKISRSIIAAIPSIPSDGSGETYNEWLKVCFVLKAAGYDRNAVNEWCGAEEFDVARWNGMNPSTTIECARAQIFKLAKKNGYQLPQAKNKNTNYKIKWYTYDIMDPITINNAVSNAQKVLDLIFRNDSSIYICNGKEQKGKMLPDSSSIVVTSKTKLNSHALKDLLQFDKGMYVQLNDIDSIAFNNYKKEKPSGSILSEHITSWKYAYIEADPAVDEEITDFITRSKNKLEKLDLPWICHLFSGKKSIHTIIQLDATSLDEWKNRRAYVHNYLMKSGYVIDTACKNPNRWERFWCAGRNGAAQYVMAINDRPCSFADWQHRHSMPLEVKNTTFSLLNDKGSVSNLAMLNFIAKQGFRTYKDGDNIVTVRLDGKFVEKVDKSSIVNTIVQEIAKNESFDIQEKVVAFLKNQPITFFAMLPLVEITKHTDTPNAVFLYYKNGVLKIESNQIALIPYANIQGYIWKGLYRSMEREYLPAENANCQFGKFIENITSDKNDNSIISNSQNMNNACAIIGYLLSRYKDPANAKAVLITDRQADIEGDFSTGGTGKGLFINAM